MLVAAVVGTLFTVSLCLFIQKGFPDKSLKRWKLCLLLALVCNLDSFFIYAKQGWEFQDWDSYLKTNYFRAPFNNDVQRNVDIIETLLRRSDNSPFLPESTLRYQVLWHQFAATLVGPFDVSVTRYPLVSGVTLATAVTFFFLLFWLLTAKAPKLSRAALVGLAVLVSTHAEIYNMVLSFWRAHAPGIEADWSVAFPLYYRNMSLKFLSLISPQHLLFFFVALLVFSPLWEHLGKRVRPFILFLGFLASPILAVLLVAWELFQSFKDKKFRWELVWSFLLAYFLFPMVMGFGLFSIFRSERMEAMGFMHLNPWNLLDLPFLLTAYLGILGAVVTLSFRKAFKGFEGMFVFWGAIVFSFLITSGELRRHFAMMAAFLSCLLLPTLFRWNRWFQVAAGLALLLHGYFIYSFTMKPGGVDPTIAWKDYFDLNQVVRTQFSDLAVIGSTSSAAGIEFPIVMEATTSYDGLPGAVAHGKTTEDQRILLHRAEQEGILALAYRLGYRAVTWGPLEEKVWTAALLDRYCDTVLAKVGTVSLYSLKENPWDEGGYASNSDFVLDANGTRRN